MYYVSWAMVGSLVAFAFIGPIVFLIISANRGWNDGLERNAETRAQLRKHRDKFNPVTRKLLKI